MDEGPFVPGNCRSGERSSMGIVRGKGGGLAGLWVESLETLRTLDSTLATRSQRNSDHGLAHKHAEDD